MFEALSTPLNRHRTYLLLALCTALAIVSGVIGISDNPPGLLFAFLSAAALLLAFAHPWRTSKQFRRLFYLSGLAFIVFAILHNLLDVLGTRVGHPGLVQGLLNGAGVIFFLVAVLLCPPGLLVGAVGAVIMSWRARHPHSRTTPA
jgi:hypothetical protein